MSDKSELQMRDELAKKDRAGWTAGSRSTIPDFTILRDGSWIVAHCRKESDRDLILTMARSYDAMREALEWYCDRDNYLSPLSFAACGCRVGVENMPVIRDEGGKARAALSLANGSKPSTDEGETGELRI